MKLEKLFQNEIFAPFLTKSYGLELLIILLDSYPNRIEGIEELFGTLQSPKPRFRTFYNHLDLLHHKDLVEFQKGTRKKSAKSIKLTATFFQECKELKVTSEE